MLPPSHRPSRWRLLALIAPIALAATAHADEVAAPSCPIGMVKCPKKPTDWSMCGKNDLLDFYVTGLPTTGDRAGTPADFSAIKVESGDKDHYVLEGDAELRRLDQLLRADTLTYDNDTTTYTATGHVRYQDRGLLISADRAAGTTEPEQATLDHLRYQLLGSRGNGRAEQARMDDPDHVRLARPTYTTCQIDDPQWDFSARDMTLDQAEGVGRAHDVTFRVGDVPIFWLPYARFPLNDERTTGFLYPNIGYSDSRGFDLTLPYYLNLAPNYDATLYPRLMSQRGLMLGGEFRYLVPGSHGEVEFTWLPDDREADRDRGSFHWQDWTGFSENWGASVNINRVSDDRYFEDFGRSLTTAATSLLPSRIYLNGHGDWWSASLGADEYQITDPTLPDQFEPYRRLPRATFNGEHAFAGDLEWGIDSELVAFSKDDALDGQRLDLYPYLAYPLETASWFVRPQLGYRYTSYHLDRDDDASPTRGVPIFSLDSGLIFERSLQLGNQAYTQTLEPRVYYLRVPYRNQDDIPIFDTQQVPFSFGQLFRSNRFVGADRQADANDLTLALTTRLLEDATGDERVSASLGEIRYFGDQRVQLPCTRDGVMLPSCEPTDFSGSTYVGELDLHIDDRWRLVLDQQWNPNSRQTDLSAISVQNRFATDGLFNFSYRFRRNFLEQVDVSTLLPITPAWRLIARENFSLRDHKTLESLIGIEHDSCCVAWRLLARHWIHNIEGEADNALYFEIEFKGIGSVGQKTDDFLRRGILGYQ
ncbi:MAG TPA: LPS assembly protein LptD [Rhodanobacteraceae bacterium]|nr:LPS assembly protein LptD [Rhodanobacteraceae bacterium]